MSQFNIVGFLGLAVVNIIGLVFANYFQTLVFLDTIATAFAALSSPYGLIYGPVVGFATNLLIGLRFQAYRKFLHVNVACGLAWGAIGHWFPIDTWQVPSEEARVIRYVLAIGFGVGVLAAVLSVPVRRKLGFKTDHLLDQVSREIEMSSAATWKLPKIFLAEFVLSHWIDKTLSTVIAVMFIVIQSGSVWNPLAAANYHDIIELLAAAYYIAMAYAIKSLGVHINADGVVAILGPLGFFSVLIALPVVIRAAL